MDNRKSNTSKKSKTSNKTNSPAKKNTNIAGLVILIVALVAALAVTLVLAFRTPCNDSESSDESSEDERAPGEGDRYDCSRENPWACTIIDKPVIYLYPESATNVEVTLGHPDLLTVSYPKYQSSWSVYAQPDGALTDLTTGRSLYALYYESKPRTDLSENLNTGFIVSKEETTSFLEEKLAILGLNSRESEEFIIYWLPILESSPYNFIRFASAEEITANMPLSITPAPDTLIRILMVSKPLEVLPTSYPEGQILTPVSRTGFTVVEWGGTWI